MSLYVYEQGPAAAPSIVFVHGDGGGSWMWQPAGPGRVQVPTLVMAGRREYGVMRRSVRDIAAAIPNARGFLLAHSQKFSLAEEHNWNLSAPDLFRRMVRAWITGQPLPVECSLSNERMRTCQETS